MVSVEGDFTTQMLYCAIKSGIQVSLADMGMNVLYDYIDYSASIDALTLSKANGKNVQYSAPQSIAEMTAKGKLRG